MKGYLILFGILLLCFFIQTTLVPLYSFYGISVDISLIILVSLSLLIGPIKGSSLGIFLGILKDLYSSGIFGINLFTKLLLGYLAGSLSQSIYPHNLLIPFLAVVGATIGHQILSTLLSEVLIFTMSLEWFMQRVFLQAFFNGILSLLIFPLCRLGLAYLVQKKIL